MRLFVEGTDFDRHDQCMPVLREKPLGVFDLLGAFSFLVGCQTPGVSPRSVPKDEPPTAPSIAQTASPALAPAPAEVSPGPAAPSTPHARRPVAHDYRKVFDDFGTVVFDRDRPLLFASQGAADLSNGKLLFERDSSNAVVFHGDSVWYADGFSPMSACPERSVLVQLVGERWVPRHELNVHALHVQPWLRGSSLAAMVPKRSGPPWGYELTVLEKNRTAPTPERAGRTREAGCHTRLSELESLLAFPSGEIFAFGRPCPLFARETTNELGETVTGEPEAPPGVEVESWAAGATKSTFDSLPFTELTSVHGVGAKDIWAAGSLPDGAFAFTHFDGKTWTLSPRRFTEAIASLAVPRGDSGPLARRFFVSGKRLYELRGDELNEHALPNECAVLDVALDGDALWVSCSTDFGMALFTTDPKAVPFSFPSDESERSLVTWRERALPALDPKGPRGRCGPAYEQSDSGKVRHKPSAPRPPRGPSKIRKELRPFEFGY